ncbi:VOC family protein [Ensifer soli]|uniref:VOC family protein n=1 Tax=Ciceribacter sp. sgz301302 TaxID=3342379 RepID=UPI0035B9AC66
MTRRYALDHMALLVRDVERSVAFYRNVLGLEEVDRKAGSANVRWMALGNGDTIHLIERDFGATHVTKDTHLALSTPDFDALVADLTGKGIAFEDWLGARGQVYLHRNGFRQIYLQDPDGYWIEVNDRVDG